MSFVDEFKNASLLKTTENGGVAYSKLDNDLLSFFAIVGAMRNRSEKDIIDMYMAARNEDKELADKIILYARDIRGGGLGERRVGRILLKELAKLEAENNFNNELTKKMLKLQNLRQKSKKANYLQNLQSKKLRQKKTKKLQS